MLQKLHRLTEKIEYQDVLRRGQISHGKFVSLRVVSIDGLTKVGIIVSNKVSKSAVERNRIKRIIRNIFEKFLKVNNSGYKFVVIVKKTTNNLEANQIINDLSLILKRYEKNSN